MLKDTPSALPWHHACPPSLEHNKGAGKGAKYEERAHTMERCNSGGKEDRGGPAPKRGRGQRGITALPPQGGAALIVTPRLFHMPLMGFKYDLLPGMALRFNTLSQKSRETIIKTEIKQQ